MLRSSLTTAGILFLGASAFAQNSARSHVHPITGPVRDAGIYHVGTQTWTRHASQANLIGADVIYCNTCPSGYYSALSGDHYVDEGRVPSPTSPNNLNSKPGCSSSYVVSGAQVAYCTDQTVAGGNFGTYTINVFQADTGCSSIVGQTPTGTIALTGPGAQVQGTQACWIVTVDSSATPFTMLADGDGTFNTAPDTFEWDMSSTAVAATLTGPIIAGDLNVCTGYDGTRWDPVVNYAEDGTGMSTENHFYIEQGPTTAGCYYFPGIQESSFHLRLYSDACGVTPTGTVFCAGDGVAPHTACPCANNSPVAAGAGCLNSFGVGATLRGTGHPSLTGDTVVLNAGGLSVSSVLFFQGTLQQGGGAGAVFGDGLRCAGGAIIRLATHNATGTGGAAVSSYPQGAEPSVSVRGLVTTPGTRDYQAWYRNAAAFCTAAVFNLSNGYEIVWVP